MFKLAVGRDRDDNEKGLVLENIIQLDLNEI